MPYCEVITNKTIDAELEETIRKEIVRIIELIPGKEERWIMTRTVDQSRMTFGGPCDAPVAMINVKTFGELSDNQYNLLTKELCASISELISVPPEKIYVVYESICHWGWNGQNF